MAESIPHPDENNRWRLDTGNESRDWDKYPREPRINLMVSGRTVQEPKDHGKPGYEEYWHSCWCHSRRIGIFQTEEFRPTNPEHKNGRKMLFVTDQEDAR